MTDFPRSVADSAPAVSNTVTRTVVRSRAVADSAPATDIAPPAGPTGNNFATPIAISGATGSTSVNLVAASIEAGEPAATAGTVWLRLTHGTGPGELTVSSTTPGAIVEVIDGTELGDLSVNVANGTAVVPTGPYYIRVYAPGKGSANVTWSFEARLSPLIITIIGEPEIAVTPGQLQVTVSNVEPEAEVHFDIEVYDSGGTLTSTITDVLVEDADTSGSLINVSVPIVGPLDAGAYMLVASTSTQEERVGFTVVSDPDIRPDPPPVITFPPYTPPVVTVNRWKVLSTVDNSVYFTFPINPSEKSTPHAPKNFSTRHTSAPTGQHITWEGAIRSMEWSLTGFLETQAFYEALEGLVISNRRWWVVDNRLRMWLVTFETFSPSHHRRPDEKNDWSYDYQLGLYIYAGPVQY